MKLGELTFRKVSAWSSVLCFAENWHGEVKCQH